MSKLLNRYLIITTLLLPISKEVFAQELQWKAGFHGFFDNREYFNDYAQPQSILGARTFAEGGFAIDEYSEFNVGVDFMFEFGADATSDNLSPILYYHYDDDRTELYMGAFPRYSLVTMPLALQNDTFYYYKPNVEGIYLSYQHKNFQQNIWLDWTSRQTTEKRETFLVGASGKVNSDLLFGHYDFLMYHYAGVMAEDHMPVRDNGGFRVIAGANLSKYTALDSLSISSGYLGSYDRLRASYDLTYYHGSLSELYANYKLFGLRSTMYFGDSQVLLVGDPMYRSTIYNRTDVILNVLRKGRVKGVVELAFHFVPGETDYSQKFVIYVDINGRRKL